MDKTFRLKKKEIIDRRFGGGVEFNLGFDESETLFFLKWRCNLKEIRLQGSGII